MPKFISWRACIALSFLVGALAACGGSSSSDDGTADNGTAATSSNKTNATSTPPGNAGDSDVRFAP